MDPHRLAAVVEGLGVARTRQLLDLGATRRQVDRAVRAGAILRLREGVYVTDRADPAISEAARHGGAVACVSVLRRYRLWVLDDDPVLHVWVGADGRTHEHDGCRCITHRDAGRTAFGEVDLLRALAQSLRCRGQEVFFVALESALRKGLVDTARRRALRAAIPAGQRWLVDLARSDADSGLESILRLRLHRLGVRMRSQVEISGVGRVDFLIGGVLILEADGKENHEKKGKRHQDLVRDAAAAARGYETLRFDYALIVHDWPAVEEAILGRLAVIRRR